MLLVSLLAFLCSIFYIILTLLATGISGFTMFDFSGIGSVKSILNFQCYIFYAMYLLDV